MSSLLLLPLQQLLLTASATSPSSADAPGAFYTPSASASPSAPTVP
jgi:hypothetical protein